jgi:hypothetical protein
MTRNTIRRLGALCDLCTSATGPAYVIVENDRITYVGSKTTGEFDAVIEGEGRYLLPGLIKMDDQGRICLSRSEVARRSEGDWQWSWRTSACASPR